MFHVETCIHLDLRNDRVNSQKREPVNQYICESIARTAGFAILDQERAQTRKKYWKLQRNIGAAFIERRFFCSSSCGKIRRDSVFTNCLGQHRCCCCCCCCCGCCGCFCRFFRGCINAFSLLLSGLKAGVGWARGPGNRPGAWWVGQAGCVGGFVRVWSALPLQVYADHNVLQSIGVRPGGIAFAMPKELVDLEGATELALPSGGMCNGGWPKGVAWAGDGQNSFR